MTPERWRQVEEIFQAALDLGPQDRARYVSEACADDATLKRDVETLLSQHESAGELLEDPLYGDTQLSALEAFAYEDEDPLIGRRLGAYRIEREIGRGGMGAVYEAVSRRQGVHTAGGHQAGEARHGHRFRPAAFP